MGKRVGATVWWIEKGSGELRNHHFSSPPNSGTYETEVHIKYAVDPIDMITIFDDRTANDQPWLDALKEKSTQMRAEIAVAK